MTEGHAPGAPKSPSDVGPVNNGPLRWYCSSMKQVLFYTGLLLVSGVISIALLIGCAALVEALIH